MSTEYWAYESPRPTLGIIFLLLFLRQGPFIEDWTQTHYAAKAALELLILPPTPYLLSTWVTGMHQQDQLNFNVVISSLETMKGDIQCKSVGCIWVLGMRTQEKSELGSNSSLWLDRYGALFIYKIVQLIFNPQVWVSTRQAGHRCV